MSFRQTQASVCPALKWVDCSFPMVCPAQIWFSPQGPQAWRGRSGVGIPVWGRGQWALGCAEGEASVAGVVAQPARRSWGLIRDPSGGGVKLGGREWTLGSGSLSAARSPEPDAPEQPERLQ